MKASIRIFQILLFLLTSSLVADEKLLIFTYSYNRPDFICMQDKTFKKFLKDEYEFVVFNDAVDISIYRQIHETCKNLNIRCIDIPQGIHHSQEPADRNGDVVDFSLKCLGYDHDGIVVLLDSDLFLVREFSIKDYMADHVLGGVDQIKSNSTDSVDYLWIGLVFLDMRKMPNKETISFAPGRVNGVAVDAGGQSHVYLNQHRYLPVRYINIARTIDALNILSSECNECTLFSTALCEHQIEMIKSFGFDDKQINFMEAAKTEYCGHFFHDGFFYHYASGTNWPGMSEEYHQRKTEILNDYFDSILND